MPIYVAILSTFLQKKEGRGNNTDNLYEKRRLYLPVFLFLYPSRHRCPGLLRHKMSTIQSANASDSTVNEGLYSSLL